jgi:hypothetical protein
MLCLDWDDKCRPWWSASSRWILLSRNQPFMLSQPLMSRATLIPEQCAQKLTLWTDDDASLFSIIRL